MAVTTPSAALPATASPGGTRRLRVLEVLLIFCVFLLHGGWPAPDVNEAHYLAKARHYWQPDWLAGDKFLESADAHVVFYWTFGWMTRVVAFPAAAWIGRLATWLLLAWSWRRLSVALLPRPQWSVLGAALFVLFSAHGHLAGEWVVGGVEAKGFAFVLVFLALERLARGDWNAAVLLCGAAAGLHVLAGGWMLLIVLAARVWTILRGDGAEEGAAACAGAAAPARRRLLALVCLLAALLLALPGLWPALQLSQGADAQTLRDARVIYVVKRLGHHLDPRQFSHQRWALHIVLVGAWLSLLPFVWRDAAWRRVGRTTLAALGVALAGGLVGLALHLDWMPDLCCALLRYYFFRTADFLVPLAAALACTRLLARWRQSESPLSGLALLLVLAVLAAHFGGIMLQRQKHLGPRGENFRTAAEFNDWRDICHQARKLTPRDAVFLTPVTRHTFRWYAERREVVNWKDVPQDAKSLVAWWRRWNDVNGTYHPTTPRSFAARRTAELKALAHRHGATHIIVEQDPQQPYRMHALEIVALNERYVLYAIEP